MEKEDKEEKDGGKILQFGKNECITEDSLVLRSRNHLDLT